LIDMVVGWVVYQKKPGDAMNGIDGDKA
jgi:hypothetical protein